jgi:ABC-type branched-subunit amino acid transport system ATPase component
LKKFADGVSYTPQGQSWSGEQLGKVYTYFRVLKPGVPLEAAYYTSGGEQQMCAIGATWPADHGVAGRRPSMGL